jgi:cobalt transporter subunit CbtA
MSTTQLTILVTPWWRPVIDTGLHDPYMFRNLLLTGLLTGVLTGCLLTLLQYFFVLPLIQQAESHENTIALPADTGESHVHSGPIGEWQPAEGLERLAYTGLANVAIASGFGLMMAGVMALRRPLTLIQAVLFGLAGYYVFFIAPAVWLPPELPGADSPGLEGRQAIWLCAVALSFSGLSFLAFAANRWLRILGLLVLFSPYLLFTRQAVHYSAPVPANLIEQFALITGLTNFVFWITLGMMVYGLQKWLIGISGSQPATR